MKTLTLTILLIFTSGLMFSKPFIRSGSGRGPNKMNTCPKIKSGDVNPDKKFNNLHIVKMFPEITAEKRYLEAAEGHSENFDYETIFYPMEKKINAPFVSIEL